MRLQKTYKGKSGASLLRSSYVAEMRSGDKRLVVDLDHPYIVEQDDDGDMVLVDFRGAVATVSLSYQLGMRLSSKLRRVYGD